MEKVLREILSMDEKVAEAVKKVNECLRQKAKVGIILGSGLGSLVNEFTEAVKIDFKAIPHFPVSSVEGHSGELVSGRFSGVNILALSGRVHFYEGYRMQEVCFPVEVMAGLGIEKLIITNASGAVNESYFPGNIIIIKDHINLTGDNPLRGTGNFVDMTDAYSGKLRDLAKRISEEIGVDTKEGVYLVLNGPSYESPAEIRMSRSLGADMVGMSTIPEVIMANSLGIEVLGLSMITNMAAGITGNPLSHGEVIETTRKAGEKFKRLVRGIITAM